jgi:hypothetical protein
VRVRYLMICAINEHADKLQAIEDPLNEKQKHSGLIFSGAAAAQQLRQLRDVGRDPPRFILIFLLLTSSSRGVTTLAALPRWLQRAGASRRNHW